MTYLKKITFFLQMSICFLLILIFFLSSYYLYFFQFLRFIIWVDIYEVIYRYWFIYVVLLIEFVILLFFLLQPLSGSDEYFLNYRINQFLFHFYYFVPALNVITRNTFFLQIFNQKAIRVLNISKNIILMFQKYLLFLE